MSKSFLACAAVAFALSAPVAEATVMQAVFTGTVTGFYDDGPVSGFDIDPNTLVDQSFTTTFVFNPDLGLRTTGPGFDRANPFNPADQPLISGVLEIGGFVRSITANLLTVVGGAHFENGGYYNLFGINITSTDNTGGEFSYELINSAHYNFGGLITDQLLDQPFSSDSLGTQSALYYLEQRDAGSNLVRVAGINGEFNSLRLTVLDDDGPSPVPLPASAFLLVGALGLMGFVRRGRRTA